MESQSNKIIKVDDQSTSEVSGGASENVSANTRRTTKETGNRLRRAFSMPRNPFRLSLRKHNNPDMVAGRTEVKGNDTIPTPPNKSTFDDDVTAATTTVTNDSASSSSTSNSSVTKSAAAVVTHISSENMVELQKQQEPQQISSAASTSSNKHRIFRRSSWKKMISRFAQQMTSINIGVSAQVQ